MPTPPHCQPLANGEAELHGLPVSVRSLLDNLPGAHRLALINALVDARTPANEGQLPFLRGRIAGLIEAAELRGDLTCDERRELMLFALGHELHIADDAEAAQLRMRGQPRAQEIMVCRAVANARKKIADARDGSDLEHRHAVAVGWLSALRLEGLVDGSTFDALYAELEAAVRTVGDSLPPAD